MKKIKETGSVRVDLLGGTLDLPPINAILAETVTLNLATTLKAEARIEAAQENGVRIFSLDYQSENFFPHTTFHHEGLASGAFGPLQFVAEILHFFGLHSHVHLHLSSGSPPGAGLGGSSTMGVTLYKALCHYTDRPFDRSSAIRVVGAIEAKILDKGQTGYQDYYPALYGGVLALVPHPAGVLVHQLYSAELARFLEQHLTLVYSGQTRLSGINNWEVYKKFFDRDQATREGMAKIAGLSHKAFEAIKAREFQKLPELIKQEGKTRDTLFTGILTEEMRTLEKQLPPGAGLKICGAGGGGCFLIVHQPEQKKLITSLLAPQEMRELTFQVDSPIQEI